MRRFWQQPSRTYRNFQIAFTLLTLNFVLPAISYASTPQVVGGQLRSLNRMLGGEPYTAPESQSRLWRYLGAANVMTLGVMCLLLQLNLRRFGVVLLPLAFLKGYNALLFLLGYVASPHWPVLLAIGLLDVATTAAFLFFAGRAIRDIGARADEDLVPRPFRIPTAFARISAR